MKKIAETPPSPFMEIQLDDTQVTTSDKHFRAFSSTTPPARKPDNKRTPKTPHYEEPVR